MTRSWRLVRLFIALLFVTNVACTPVVYVQPTGTMSFQQLLEADATMDARIAAHAMRGLGAEPAELFAKAGFEFVAQLFQPHELLFESLYAFIGMNCFFDLAFDVHDKGFEHRKANVELSLEQTAIRVPPRLCAPCS